MAPKPNLTQHRVILLAIDLGMANPCLPSYRTPASNLTATILIVFLQKIIIYAFLCRRAVRRKFAPIDAYDNPVFQSLLKDLHTLHLYAVDLEAFCLLYGLFQVIKILLRFRTKLQQCNFFSGNGWRMPLIPLPPDTTATRRWRNY